MEIRVIDTEERLNSIEKDWNDLLAKKGKPSFFSSFDYFGGLEHSEGRRIAYLYCPEKATQY
jgi:hypothetical protein